MLVFAVVGFVVVVPLVGLRVEVDVVRRVDGVLVVVGVVDGRFDGTVVTGLVAGFVAGLVLPPPIVPPPVAGSC